ncbi:MAG: hypothetical protein JKY03_08865 [Aureispira sp.]|nr:hypothetical protein [Aureispira sp.]
MRIIFYTIMIALSTLSCVEENNTNNDTKISTELSIDTSSKTRIDSTIIESNSIKKEQTFINPEFLNLVKTIDSLGYLYDTIKLRKSYRHFNFVKKITKKGYLFYKHKLENTTPFITQKRILSQINSRASKDKQ